MAEIIKKQLKETIKKLTLRALVKAGWAIFTTAVVIAAAGTTIWLYAAFTEPAAGPASSDQDFAQNVMGANNANNDFDSALVVSNRDGSLLERTEFMMDNQLAITNNQLALGTNDANNAFSSALVVSNRDGSLLERAEYIINYLVSGATCGNGVKEYGEGCDDGGTSWTSGACAGDCSRRNYWSNPLAVGNYSIDAVNNSEANRYFFCQERGFISAPSFSTATLAAATLARATYLKNGAGGYDVGSALWSYSNSTEYFTYFHKFDVIAQFGFFTDSSFTSTGSYTISSSPVWSSFRTMKYIYTHYDFTANTATVKYTAIWCAD